MRAKPLRNNYLGLAGYALVLLGIVCGGIWIVLLATANTVTAVTPGIIGAVLLLSGLAMLAYVRIRGRQDPLEPAVVNEETIVDEDSGPGRTPGRASM